MRILAGHQNGDYADRLGRIWQSDRYFQGGSVFESHDHPIYGTREPKIYQSRREGSFAYEIPLPPGVYELRLHFAETLFGENNVAGGGESSRVFNVSINGKEALHEFDVIGEVGPSTADVRAFKDISPAADGKVHLNFESFNNQPLLSAIEIVPGTPGKLRPIRMLSLDRPYVDKQGRFWEPDRYARGGQLVVRTKPVEGALDPAFRIREHLLDRDLSSLGLLGGGGVEQVVDEEPVDGPDRARRLFRLASARLGQPVRFYRHAPLPKGDSRGDRQN